MRKDQKVVALRDVLVAVADSYGRDYVNGSYEKMEKIGVKIENEPKGREMHPYVLVRTVCGIIAMSDKIDEKDFIHIDKYCTAWPGIFKDEYEIAKKKCRAAISSNMKRRAEKMRADAAAMIEHADKLESGEVEE